MWIAIKNSLNNGWFILLSMWKLQNVIFQSEVAKTLALSNLINAAYAVTLKKKKIQAPLGVNPESISYKKTKTQKLTP